MTKSMSNALLSLDELTEKADVNKLDTAKLSYKSCITFASRLYIKGDKEYSRGEYQDAYVSYMMGCSITVDIIPKYRQHREAEKDIRYQELKSKTELIVLERLEQLKDLFLQPAEEDDVDDVMNKYPPVDALETSDNGCVLDDLPDVPTHIPNIPVPVTMKMPEPQPLPPSSTNHRRISLPTPSDYPVPHVSTVDPLQLASWIIKNKGSVQPSVLILDVRPREVFDNGLIRHTYICQIEPLRLRNNVNSNDIQQSLVLNPVEEQKVFAERNRFDAIVYYDQNSTYPSENRSLQNLCNALDQFEYRKILQHPPIMLAGGFDGWRKVIGEHGIYKYPTVEHKKEHVMTPVKVHHTVYDYFTGSSSTKESMSRQNRHAPPLRGVFSNEVYHPSTTQYQPTSMPIPEPTIDSSHTQSMSTSYPTVQPNQSSLVRRNTFIDNPFHGFTETANKQYDIPPLPPKPSRPLPSIPVITDVPALPPKPDDSYRTAPVSDNSFSQVGNAIVGTTGLKNLGNTCYMNSIIQCLSGTIPLARYFISGTYKQHINKTNILGTKGELAMAFSDLLRTMWSGNFSFISPVPFREALLKFAPQFQGNEQHDSQEFLNFLLDGLHEDCNLITQRPPPIQESKEDEARFESLPDWQASTIAWDRYFERNSSVIVSLFQGQYRSRLTCQTCHATSTTYNSFMSLSLPIPATRKGPATVSIYQCLDYFVKEEILENDDAWNCPRCRMPRRATKSLTLSKLPLVLLIHLKRFSYDGPFKDKLETIVQSPMNNLDLSRYVPSSMISPDQPHNKSDYNYDLYAVSNHYGSLTGGHYTACVRNTYRKEWHNFDDTRFSVCDESKVLSRAAYNLFYVRSTVQ